MSVDFITTYVNMDDPNWRNLYRRYVNRNLDFDNQRFRDYGMIKYQLRSIEKFMPWIRNVVFIVQSKSQIPKWLNTNNPRLRIVYHQDYIPKIFLPTFNSNVIEMFIHYIPRLAEKFILANDDMLAVSKVEESFFFKGNLPIYKKEVRNSPSSNYGMFSKILRNNMLIERKIAKSNKLFELVNHHLMTPYNLSFWKEQSKNCKLLIARSLINSRKRLGKNLNHWLIRDLGIITGSFVDDQNLNCKGYVAIKDNITESKIFERIKGAKTACFNDCFSNPSAALIARKVLDSILPDKSSFEI